MQITMISAVSKRKNVVNLIGIILFFAIFLSCQNKEKIYLDFKEVQMNSDADLNSVKKGDLFSIYNVKDTIYLQKLDEKLEYKAVSDLREIKFTSIDEVLSRLSKITINNLHVEENKIPELFIVRKDKRNKKFIIFKVGQTYPISNHRPRGRNEE